MGNVSGCQKFNSLASELVFAFLTTGSNQFDRELATKNTQMNLKKNTLVAKIQWIVVLQICMTVGCGNPAQLQDVIARVQKAQTQQSSLLVDQESDLYMVGSHSKTTTEMEFPSPERVNPFVWDQSFDEQSGSENGKAKREVKVMGFVTTDQQRVVLSINGETVTLSVGQIARKVEVLEIAIPVVRLSVDGIEWSTSIFDSDRRLAASK